jgi:hypothetical protein
MIKITCLLFIALLLLTSISRAQQPPGTVVDSATANKVLQQCAKRFPKFYREYNYITRHDTLIKNFVFMRYDRDMGPARAGPRGNIFIDIKYLESQQPDMDDNRLSVVLYHEIGHLHFFSVTPPGKRFTFDSEKAAFEYSLLKTKEIAEKGDCLPLKTGVKFMKIRSEGNNLQDPHVIALKKLVLEPLYAGYVTYVKEKCP